MKNKINILIIEDEVLAAKKLKKLLGEIDPNFECLGVLDSIESSIKWLSTNPQPNLILMDIELADGQSFEIFSNVDIKCPVIFTTAYDEFALKEFKVNSVDYLLKPIKKDELESAINKWRLFTASSWSGEENTSNIKELIENLISGQTKGYKSKFLIKSGHRLVPISTDEIAYFYTEEKVVFIRTTNNARYMTDYILEDLETILDPAIFFRANRQYIINSKCVHNIEQWFNGKLKVKVQPPAPEDVIISREKAPEFKTWIAS